MEDSQNTKLTFGERAVGLTFNPSGNNAVQRVKENFAVVIDHLRACSDDTSDGEKRRMYAIAITEAQTAQMWAVKAITWDS